MLHNSIKSNWTLEQLNWKLYEPGKLEDYDGLTSLFIQLVNANKDMLKDNYIKNGINCHFLIVAYKKGTMSNF